jgi:hypothetical protein
MRKIIFLIAVLIVTAFTSCKSDPQEEARKRAEVYYENEDFTLADRKEELVANGSSPIRIRTWIIHRLVNRGDSIEVGEIIYEFKEDCGCSESKDFAITNEVWYNKKIGDKLHFEYIRKDRFFKVANVADVQIIPKEATVVPTPVENSTNSFDKELKIIELERQIIEIQNQIETLKLK